MKSIEGEAATMIILICAGRNRMNMIRRELPRSSGRESRPMVVSE